MDESVSENCIEYENKDAASDVYAIIKSAEIKDYFRKENSMGIFEKEQLILHSYISVQQKTAMLKQLSSTGNEEENRKVDELYRVYREYINLIYHPLVRTVFLLEYVEQWWENDDIETDSNMIGAFDTVDEVIEEMAGIYDGKEVKCYGYGYVTVLQVPQDAKVKEVFTFELFWIDGKWQIMILNINADEREVQGIGEDTADRYGNTKYHCSLPFKNGDKLKIQLPFMEKPCYGILRSEKDENGCRSYWLNRNGKEGKRIDLTKWELFYYSGYSMLDWIERV